MDNKERYAECTTIEEVMQFVDKRIEEKKVSDVIARQVRLLAEEVMSYVVEEVNPEEFYVSCTTLFGESTLRITFKGNLSLNISDYSGDNMSLRILKNNLGRLKVRNGSVNTSISILFKEKMEQSLKKSAIALMAACIIGVLMCNNMPAEMCQAIALKYIWPITLLFIKLLQLIATPVTILCLTINVSKILDMSVRFPNIRRVELKYLATSVLASFVGIIVALGVTTPISSMINPAVVGDVQTVSIKLSGLWKAITNMAPNNILELLTGASPAVLIFTCVFFGIAVGLVDRESGNIQVFLEMIRDVFCKALSIIVHLTPFIIFIIVLELILEYGLIILLYEGILMAALFIAVAALILMYALQLKLSGVKPRSFLTDFKECFADVVKIGSSVDAVPNTIKYCNKKMPKYRKLIEMTIPLGAQTNMDGVVMIESLIIMTFLQIGGNPVSALQIIMMGLMVVFVSIGAPNQPGTLTIVSAVVMPQFGLDTDVLPTVVLMELIFNRILAVLDTVGDVVSTRVEIERLNRINKDLNA